MLERIEGLANSNAEALKLNIYPGRGIVAGHNQEGQLLVVYWIMGRSSNSRNRMFVAEGDHVRTEAVDPARVEDPSLIIYHPLRQEPSVLFLSNGDQTDTLWKQFRHQRLVAEGAGETLPSLLSVCTHALQTRTYEPDAPNFTPRISLVAGTSKDSSEYLLSILKIGELGDGFCQRNYYHFERATPGFGHLIHTYVSDGDPLPSYCGEPVLVPIQDSVEEALAYWWDKLNPEHRISLLVRKFAADGSWQQKIINRFA